MQLYAQNPYWLMKDGMVAQYASLDKNTYFALGFGGNGITFSVIAAEIIRDMIMNKKNENASLFEFNR
jgi:glycine/D-amino acid oxidase-like deaminating enzyme